MKILLNVQNLPLFRVLGLFLLAAFVFAGCGTAKDGTKTNADKMTAPDWADQLPPKEEYWGIGFAKLQNESLARDTAAARARRDVASQIGILVQGMLTDYARESGTLNNSASIQSIERIGRDIIDMNLLGAVPNAQKRMNDGTWWVRVTISKASLQKQVEDVFQTEASRYADFKAKEALKMLDTQLDKAQSKPTPRSED